RARGPRPYLRSVLSGAAAAGRADRRNRHRPFGCRRMRTGARRNGAADRQPLARRAFPGSVADAARERPSAARRQRLRVAMRNVKHGKTQWIGPVLAALTLPLISGCEFGNVFTREDSSPADWQNDARTDDGSDGGNVIEYLDVDRKSTRLNSSHVKSSYAVFCL